jgi:hypothetical protein
VNLSERDLNALAEEAVDSLLNEIEPEIQRRTKAWGIVLRWARTKSAERPGPEGAPYRLLEARLMTGEGELPPDLVDMVNTLLSRSPAPGVDSKGFLSKHEYT